jgi:hypothetical protein
MRSRATRSHSRPGRSYARSLAKGDWELLVRLPARLLAGVLSIRAGPPPVDGVLAGLAAIAAARTTGGVLVREVVAAIFANDDLAGEGATGTDPVSGGVADCAAAGRVLAQRIRAVDAADYRYWLLHVAAVACEAFHDDPLGPARARLLDEYERALGG